MNKNIPAISIIIPMYNSEKYISDCLDNILIQTFQDFEVIVVDDCSTDKSCDVVESYLLEFNSEYEKLKLLRRKVNSGGEGTPRNIGVNISCGEYILFIDSDDFIKTTALEELYTIAKKFDADVVHCEKFLQFLDGQENFQIESYQTGEFVNEPTLLTEDLSQRVSDMYHRRFLLNVWSKLIRREFIAENQITTLEGIISPDVIFTYCLVYLAKNYVRVPNIINFYRIHDKSITHKSTDVAKHISKWIKSLLKGFVYLDNFLLGIEFFQKNPDAKYLALETWLKECVQYFQGIYAQVQPFQLDEIIRRELAKVDNKAGLMAFLFNQMNIFNVTVKQQETIIQQQNQIIQQLQAQIQQLQH